MASKIKDNLFPVINLDYWSQLVSYTIKEVPTVKIYTLEIKESPRKRAILKYKRQSVMKYIQN